MGWMSPVHGDLAADACQMRSAVAKSATGSHAGGSLPVLPRREPPALPSPRLRRAPRPGAPASTRRPAPKPWPRPAHGGPGTSQIRRHRAPPPLRAPWPARRQASGRTVRAPGRRHPWRRRRRSPDGLCPRPSPAWPRRRPRCPRRPLSAFAWSTSIRRIRCSSSRGSRLAITPPAWRLSARRTRRQGFPDLPCPGGSPARCGEPAPPPRQPPDRSRRGRRRA